MKIASDNYIQIFLVLVLLSAIQVAFAQDDKTIELKLTEAKKLSLQWTKESIQQSTEIYLESVRDLKELQLDKKIIGCYREIGHLKRILGKKDLAFEFYKKSLKIAEKTNDFDEKIKTLSALSILSFDIGKIDESKKYFEDALLLSDRNSQPASRAIALFSAGEFYFYRKEINKALDFYEKSLLFWQESGDLQGEAGSLLEIGYVHLDKYEFDLGIKNFNLALAKWKEAGDIRGQAISYVALGIALTTINEKQKALESFKEAEKLFPDDIDYFEKAILFNGIGRIYEDYEDWKQSIIYREKAFDAYQKAQHFYGQLYTLPSLGRLQQFNKNNSLALKYFAEAEKLAIKLKDNYFLARIRENLGNYYLENYAPEKAFFFFGLALPTYKKNNYLRGIANIEFGLGKIYQSKKNFIASRQNFRNASLNFQQIQNKFAQSEILYNFADLDLIENKTDDALKNINESINLTESFYSDVANTNLKRSYFSNVYDRYELYIHLLMQKHKESSNQDFAVQGLQASEKARSRSLLETLRLSEANFTKDANPELVNKEKELRNLLNLKTDKLTELLSSNAEKTETDKIEDEIRTLGNEMEDIKAKFRQESPIYFAVKNPPPFDVTQFQQNIPDNKTLLLEFSLGERESYLWLIGKTEVSSVVLPARKIIENRIEKIKQAFDLRQILPDEEVGAYQKRISDLENIFNQEAKLLSNELLGQVVDKIADKRLIIVPDGKLALLPLSVLPFPKTDEPLILRNEIIYQPSASFLNLLQQMKNRKYLAKKDLLVFADPVFSADDNRLTAKNEGNSTFATFLGLNLRDFRLMDTNGKIPRLFATQEEADSIAEVVGKSNTEIASGFAANRERVLNSDISNYRMLHFATHGLIDAERPEVSGIVLSQFDENGNKREGFLRLQDIYALDLTSDLVVLSACQSGVGKEIKGEGLMSLNNAFLQAGAKSVLSSSWKVDDDATADFMKRFYANLINKQFTPSESLRQAQIEMFKSSQFKSPFYWGAFTLQGEFRQPISVRTSYFYPILLAISAIIGVILLRRFKLLRFIGLKSNN